MRKENGTKPEPRHRHLEMLLLSVVLRFERGDRIMCGRAYPSCPNYEGFGWDRDGDAKRGHRNHDPHMHCLVCGGGCMCGRERELSSWRRRSAAAVGSGVWGLCAPRAVLFGADVLTLDCFVLVILNSLTLGMRLAVCMVVLLCIRR